MEVGKRTGGSIQKAQSSIHHRTSLAIPDIDREMRVEADTSDYTTEGVLSTKYEDGKWRPVTFISKSLNATEQNYKIHNKEMLAVIRCLRA